MLHKVTLVNGRRIYKEEGSKLRCYDPETISYKLFDMESSVGKLVQYEKSISTNESLKELDGVRLTFNVGYAIGASLTRMFRVEDSQGILCFRDDAVESRVYKAIDGMIESRSRIRMALRLSRRDEYWFKSRVISNKFFNIISLLGMKPRSAGSPKWLKIAPMEFKKGMFVGLFDSRGAINCQNRVRSKRDKCFTCIVEVSEQSVHGLVSQICSGIDIESSESFTSSRGENKNRTVFNLWSVDENIETFELVERGLLKSRLGEMSMANGGHREVGNFAPCFSGLNRLAKNIDGSIKGRDRLALRSSVGLAGRRSRSLRFIEKYNLKKSDNDKLRRWAELFKPDHRWSVVKSIEEHHTARY